MLGLQAVIRRKKSYKNYREKSAGFKYENTLNREFHTEKPSRFMSKNSSKIRDGDIGSNL
jgi:hypothetical protein